MNIIEQYADKINGTFSFFDRIIIKGHVKNLTCGRRINLHLVCGGILLNAAAVKKQRDRPAVLILGRDGVK